MTALQGARIRSVHLALPGYDPDGPTLELFSYQPADLATGHPAIDRQGLGHTAVYARDLEGNSSEIRNWRSDCQ